MSFDPRVLTIIAGITGGGCGVVPLILWKTNSLPSSGVKVSLPAKAPAEHFPPAAISKEDTNEGNCEMIKHLDPDVFFDLGQEGNSYYTFSCKNTTNKDSSVKVKNDWLGLLPNTLLMNRDTIYEGRKMNINTRTSSLGSDGYRTIFTGDRFEGSSVTGEWKNESTPLGEKYHAITVNVSDGRSNSFPIYLLFTDTNPFE